MDAVLTKSEHWLTTVHLSDRSTALARIAREWREALIANPGNTEGALAAYERDMFVRTEPLAAESTRNLELFFNDDAPQSVVDLFTHHRSTP